MSCGCGCAMGTLDDATRALIGAKAYGCGPSSPAMGEFVIGVWPSDVDKLKAKIGPTYDALDATVKACAGVDAGTRAAWDAKYSAWQAFAKEETPWFGAGQAWDLAREYETNLRDWQTKIRGMQCTLTTPIVEPPSSSSFEGTSDAIKWVAGAVIVVGAVYLLAPVVRTAFR